MMHRAFTSPSRWMLAALALAAPAACGVGAGADSSSDIAADSSEISSQEVAFIQVSSGGLGTDGAMTPETMAQTAANQSGTFLQSASCVTATASGATVTYQFTDCTGPWGLVHVTGTAVATYSPAAGGFNVAVTATGLRVNGATVDLNTTATVTGPAGARTAQVATQSHGTSARGLSFTRSGNYTASWDGTCLGLGGTFSTEVARASWTTTVTDFRVCRSECPQSGTIAVTGSGGRTTTVAFSGGPSATVTGAAGRTTTVRLFCGAN